MWYDGIVRDVRIESDEYVSHQIYYPSDGDLQWHILADEEVILPAECCDYDKNAKYDAVSLASFSQTKRLKRRQPPPPPVLVPDEVNKPVPDERWSALPLEEPSLGDDRLESPMIDDGPEAHSAYEVHIRDILTSHPIEELTLKYVRLKLEARLKLNRNALKPQTRTIAAIVDEVMISLTSSPVANSVPVQVDSPDKTTLLLDKCPFYNAICGYLSPTVAGELAVYCQSNDISNQIKRSLISNLSTNSDLVKVVEETSPDEVCAWSCDDMKTPQQLAQKSASQMSYYKWHTRGADDDDAAHASASQLLGDFEYMGTSAQQPTLSQDPPPCTYAHESMEKSADPPVTQPELSSMQTVAIEADIAMAQPAAEANSLTFNGSSLEDDLFQTMTADPAKAAVLFGSSGNVLRNNLLHQIHAAGGEVDAMHRAFVRAYRKTVFNWTTYTEGAKPKKGVNIHGMCMYRPGW